METFPQWLYLNGQGRDQYYGMKGPAVAEPADFDVEREPSGGLRAAWKEAVRTPLPDLRLYYWDRISMETLSEWVLMTEPSE